MSVEVNFSTLCHELVLRPAKPTDAPFIEGIYHSARPDLLLIDGSPELIASVQQQQWQVMTMGSGENNPNAMHFIVEKQHSQLGVVMVDFGHQEVRIIFLAILPQARGQGYGKQVLQGLQQAAQRVGCPLAAVVWQHNTQAQRLYHELGFVPQDSGEMANKWLWYPARNKVFVGAG